jgi:hypothetical protein
VSRRIAIAGAVAVLATVGTAFGLAGSAGAASASGGCSLRGTAAFSPGLSSTAANFNYSFSGTLSSCQSTDSTAPTSGTVEAGKTIVIGGTTYQEPGPTGNGSCSSSTTSGIAILTWKDGTHTVISYSTTGVGAAVQLTGTVFPSVTVTSSTGNATIATDRYAGASANGQLTFGTTTPQDCVGAGLATASINGATELN